MLVNTPTVLGNALREARKDNGLKQTDLGLRQATVSNFESNPEKSTIETLFKLLSINGLEMHIVPKGKHITETKGAVDEW
ncbi:helix-turn-helix domain-containing protein [Vibrio parahaemolyticus]|uniref:Predicted transcriptional regulator n=1 Tax=Vibrio vulnificus (strain CMCP6) TaxID=216895 RepID=A0A3Q0L4W1_VIBVU|nr:MULTISPECIES: helix-turn-helix domain-containing protein [Vibrio]MEA3481016.1 helix-turn-helix domain-containing protein [Pseudomonadota bacterium]AAO10438.1 Predicted transcriptional regulator [Vibrio vulnificus CMCP6]EJB8405383.1 helix-turn-helix domain-containing protein [Vibrio parahaemolyticus]EJB8532869.1 helix-turn-helix domain-containing protein [Vibrio parahaemolyticus]EJX5603888.1 helix-turn-helix domain-containing protein [Vibrio parahaemolyticus]